MDIFQVIGDLFQGVTQTVTNVLNMLIEWMPNPDPFPDMILSMNDSTPSDVATIAVWWLDTLIDINWAVDVIIGWAALMAASAFIALVWWCVTSVRG